MIHRIFPLIYLVLVVFCHSSIAGPGVEEKFHQANSIYSTNQFHEAIVLYEEILDNHGYSSAVLYNLANAYGQAGMTGKAIVNYERGLRLDPSNSDIRGNLTLIRKHHGLFTPKESLVSSMIHWLDLKQWVYLIAFCLVLFTVTVVLTFTPKVTNFLQTRRVVAGLSLLILFTAAYCVYTLRSEWNPSIVIQPEMRLQLSPFEGAASTGEVQEGRRVHILQYHNGYVYVRVETGQTGWLEHEVVEAVIQ